MFSKTVELYAIFSRKLKPAYYLKKINKKVILLLLEYYFISKVYLPISYKK